MVVSGPGPRSAAIPIVRPSSSTTTTAAAANNANSPRIGEGRLPGGGGGGGGSSTAAGATAGSTSSNEPRLCKNIAIYGHCKFEGKGCAYSHDVDGAKKAASTPTPSRPGTPTAAALHPISGTGAGPPSASTPLSAIVASANVFVPKAAPSSPAAAPRASLTKPAENPPTPASLSSQTFDAAETEEEEEEDELFDSMNPYASPASSVSQPLPSLNQQNYYEPQAGAMGYDSSQADYEYAYPSLQQSMLAGTAGQAGAHLQQQAQQQHAQQQQIREFQPTMGLQGQEVGYYGPAAGSGGMAMSGMGTFLHGQGTGAGVQPLQYHLYQPPVPSLSSHPSHIINSSFFFSPTIREELQRRHEFSAQLPTHKLLADGEIMPYWGLVPLDRKLPGQGGPANDRRDLGVYGYRTWAYKCTNENDGKCYALRRVEGFRLNQEAAIATVERWAHRINHPNIVKIKEAFTTRAFGDHSLVFVYDYHPLSSNLTEVYLNIPPPARGQPPPPLINERVLWSYLIQLANAIKTVHQAGMAVRCLDPSKILITGQNRLRINCIGVLDVIAYDGGKNTTAFQQEDLLSLGKLLLSLACLSSQAVHNLPQSLDVVSRTYSQDFHTALLYLLSKPNPPRKNIDDFLALPVVREKVFEELNGALLQGDSLEAELGRELENGRLVRLLTKFGFINERPEYDHDPRWAETGDRYIIKLFRDYLFHQIDEHGRPVLDLSHVLTNLNKLDAGVDEQLVLVSRDEQSCLIVSYREIKNCLESSFRELSR